MGIVFLGRDPVIGRMVALKTIRAVGEDDIEQREFRERFLREAQAAGILSHPNIVTVHDVGEDPVTSTSFIAMEYVEGKNVKQLLQEKFPFSHERAAEIIGQVAEALDYAHRRGIVHRDVKPANIIITPDGVVKITDFGIAKIEKSNLTSTGQFLGTPNYMSPEQVTGEAVDGRSDLFSLGVVLYELLTRKKPFSGENLTQISYKIVHESFTPPQIHDSSLPPELIALLNKALAKDPAERFQRGNDCALALYEYKAREEERQMLRDLGQMVAAAEKLGPISAVDGASTAYVPPASVPQPPAPAPPQAAPAPRPATGTSFAPPAIRALDPDATPPGGVRGSSKQMPPRADLAAFSAPERAPSSSAGPSDWQLDEEILHPQAKPTPPPTPVATPKPAVTQTPPRSNSRGPADDTGKSQRGRGEERPAPGPAPRTLEPSSLYEGNSDGEGLTERISTTDLFGRTSASAVPLTSGPTAPSQPAAPSPSQVSAASSAPRPTPPPAQPQPAKPAPVPFDTMGDRPTEIISDPGRILRSSLAGQPGPSAPPQAPPGPPALKNFPQGPPPIPQGRIPDPLMPPAASGLGRAGSSGPPSQVTAPPLQKAPALAHPTTVPPKKGLPSGQLPAVTPKPLETAKGGSLRREVNNRYVYMILGGSVLIAIAIAGFFMLRRASEEKPVAPVEDSQARKVAENRTLMEEGNRLIMEGRYAEALAKYRELTNRAPDSAAARDAVQKTEVLLADQQKRDTRAKEIADRIEAARQAQSVGDDDRAIAEAEMALGLDPENSDARALKEASEARKTAVAKTASDQQKKEELAKKRARVTPTPFRVVETKKEPVVVIPPTPTPATASLKVYFDCPITDGYVMIRQNDKEIFRRSINFGRKSQGGIIEGVVQVSAGKSEFKIWVISTDNSVRQYLPSTIEVPGGENRTLRLELDTNKKLSVYLR